MTSPPSKTLQLSSKPVKFLVILVLLGEFARSDVLTQKYRASRNHTHDKLCSNAMQPDQTIKLVRSPIVCSGECSLEEQCVGFNYRSSHRACELFHQPGPMEFGVMEDCSYYDRVSSTFFNVFSKVTVLFNNPLTTVAISQLHPWQLDRDRYPLRHKPNCRLGWSSEYVRKSMRACHNVSAVCRAAGQPRRTGDEAKSGQFVDQFLWDNFV